MLLTLLPALPLRADKTLRGKLRTAATAKSENVPPAAETAFDTICAPAADRVRLSGYDKPLGSRVESLFVSNSLGTGISEIEITLDYTDMQGRTLHQAVRRVRADIPSGTTLPEVMVSTTSALSGHGEIAYGNAIGSVICNTALIAAITVAVRPGRVDPKSLRLPVAFFFTAAAIYAGVAYTTGNFSRSTGLIMLGMFFAYMAATVAQMKSHSSAARPAPQPEGEENSVLKDVVLLAAGAALIAVGADLLVDNGTLIAKALGVPESVIALTFVALGTSLPELVTAITSLAKGHGALSLGNVIGANLFNLVLVYGVSVTLAPFSIPQNSTIAGYNASLVLDIPVMLAVMAFLTLPALKRGKLSRFQGVALLLAYGVFCVIQFTI